MRTTPVLALAALLLTTTTLAALPSASAADPTCGSYGRGDTFVYLCSRDSTSCAVVVARGAVLWCTSPIGINDLVVLDDLVVLP